MKYLKFSLLLFVILCLSSCSKTIELTVSEVQSTEKDDYISENKENLGRKLQIEFFDDVIKVAPVDKLKDVGLFRKESSDTYILEGASSNEKVELKFDRTFFIITSCTVTFYELGKYPPFQNTFSQKGKMILKRF